MDIVRTSLVVIVASVNIIVIVLIAVVTGIVSDRRVAAGVEDLNNVFISVSVYESSKQFYQHSRTERQVCHGNTQA